MHDFGGGIPNRANLSGLVIGSSIISFINSNYYLQPPISAYVVVGRSSTYINDTVGSKEGGKVIYIYNLPPNPTLISSSKSPTANLSFLPHK